MAQTKNPTRSHAHEASQENGADTISFDIRHHIGVLSTSSRGWTREVNLVSWNDKPPRLDIRDWDPAHEKMSRGVALNARETESLRQLLSNFSPTEAGLA